MALLNKMKRSKIIITAAIMALTLSLTSCEQEGNNPFETESELLQTKSIVSEEDVLFDMVFIIQTLLIFRDIITIINLIIGLAGFHSEVRLRLEVREVMGQERKVMKFTQLLFMK